MDNRQGKDTAQQRHSRDVHSNNRNECPGMEKTGFESESGGQ